MRRTGPALAGICLLVTSLGGCDVTTSRRPAFDTPVAIEVQKTQKLHLDLRRHLSRADAGIPDEGNSVAYGRRAPGFLDVRVQLPEGKVLEMQATDATVAATGLDGGDRSEADYVLLIRIEPDAQAAEQVLRAEADRFGFSGESLESAVQQAYSQEIGSAFVETRLGHVNLTITVRTNESDRRVQLSYALSWNPDEPVDAAPTPSS